MKVHKHAINADYLLSTLDQLMSAQGLDFASLIAETSCGCGTHTINVREELEKHLRLADAAAAN